MIESFIAAFATLFVTLDPIGNVPIFMALMAPYPIGVQRAIAVRSCLMALGILLAFGKRPLWEPLIFQMLLPSALNSHGRSSWMRVIL